MIKMKQKGTLREIGLVIAGPLKIENGAGGWLKYLESTGYRKESPSTKFIIRAFERPQQLIFSQSHLTELRKIDIQHRTDLQYDFVLTESGIGYHFKDGSFIARNFGNETDYSAPSFDVIARHDPIVSEMEKITGKSLIRRNWKER